MDLLGSVGQDDLIGSQPRQKSGQVEIGSGRIFNLEDWDFLIRIIDLGSVLGPPDKFQDRSGYVGDNQAIG